MRSTWLFSTLLGVLLTLGVASASADEGAYPEGSSVQEIEGLQVSLVVPRIAEDTPKASLLIVLHGAGGTATGMAGSFAGWAKDGYVVCAPKSKGQVWEKDDLDRALRIAAHVKRVLPIDPDKVHVVGFSNGGWNLHPLAFDDDLHPCSATWMAAGFRGGSVPKWAKTSLGAIALAGSEDANASAARATVPALEGKVRSVEVRIQPGLGHKFTNELMPYLRWWMGVQEGRFTPGEDMSFDWTEDLDAALATLEGAKKGGVLVYVYSPEDAERPEARIIQEDVFFDPEVRFLGNQLPCVKLERERHEERVAALKVKSTPALVVLDRKGKVKKVYEGKVKPRKVARTLRGVAPIKRMPD